MNARTIGWIETGVERGAAALFAAAIGYAVNALLRSEPSHLYYALAAGIPAYLLCSLALKMVGRSRPLLKVPVFDIRELELPEDDELLLTETFGGELLLTERDRLGDELVLTDEDRVDRRSDISEPLLLDDVLAAVDADSRVVRLFDRQAMPTPGQLSTTIEHHLQQGSRQSNGDASQALSDALKELKRSLR